jgi:hypothetical protein
MDAIGVSIPVEDSILHKVGDFFGQVGDGLQESAVGVAVGGVVGYGLALAAGHRRAGGFTQHVAMAVAPPVAGLVEGAIEGLRVGTDGTATDYIAGVLRVVAAGGSGYFAARGTSSDTRPNH